MKLVFVTNYINHHQVYLADEFYLLLGEGYKFISTMDIPVERRKLGYPDYSERPYHIMAYKSQEIYNYALQYINEADVVIVGSAPEEMLTQRIHDGKLIFRYSERWFKSKPWYLTGPRGWWNIYINHLRYNNKPIYMLCASAFTAKDVNAVGAYKNKCYKWGYFTKVEDLDVETLINGDSDRILQIMWCARFLKWKHPELPVKLAARLKSKGYNFVIDMYGSGEELAATKNLAKKINVEDVVNFCGNKPNNEILSEMKRHDIFLFTSDRNEGWGAVLNEAMSNGCAIVGSDEIGSVPFLIDDGINGFVFKSQNLDSLEEKVICLIDNPVHRIRMIKKAYENMRDVWSPKNAAKQFLQLYTSLKVNDSAYPLNGPASLV